MRKVCLFATQHQFQLDSPMDSAFDARLRELIQGKRLTNTPVRVDASVLK